jgi:hypothetical protein
MIGAQPLIDPDQLDGLKSRSDLVRLVHPIIEAISHDGFVDGRWTDNALAEFLVGCVFSHSEESQHKANELLRRFPYSV